MCDEIVSSYVDLFSVIKLQLIKQLINETLLFYKQCEKKIYDKREHVILVCSQKRNSFTGISTAIIRSNDALL